MRIAQPPRAPQRAESQPRRHWRALSLTLYATLGADLVLLFLSDDHLWARPVVGMSFTFYGVLGIGFAIRASLHPRLDSRTRRAWTIITVAFVLVAASAVLRGFFPLGVTFPSPADVLRLLFGPVLLLGLLTLPLRVTTPRERPKIWLDAGIVVVASIMLLWYARIGPTSAAGSISRNALLAALAYPAVDVVLIFGVVAVLFRGGSATIRRPATLFGLALLALVTGDVLLGYQQSQGRIPAAEPWQFACWLVGHFLLAMTAVAQCEQAHQHEVVTEEPRVNGISYLPYLAIVLSYGLLVAAMLGESLRVIGLTVGGITITAFVVVRQVLATHENRRLAVTDPLTGLSNRRYVQQTLRVALARAARNGKVVAAVMVDLNGFKQINDTLGHDAGDRYLIAVSKILRRNVLGLDEVGRLGGDEFVVVLHDVETAENVRAIIERISDDMLSPVLIDDTPVQPKASFGIALSNPGQYTAEQVLHRADVAMYRAKQSTRSSGETSFAFDMPPGTPEVGSPATQSRDSTTRQQPRPQA